MKYIKVSESNPLYLTKQENYFSNLHIINCNEMLRSDNELRSKKDPYNFIMIYAKYHSFVP